jgi:phospholipid/cholesterol/gamma-HCH transport system permease protein
LNTTGGAEQVGRSTTRAVVMSIFLVILVDLVFTMLFYFLGEH